MIKPSAAFNLTKIIESLDVSASSESENTLKIGVGEKQFSTDFAAAMDKVQKKIGEIGVAALSKSGKSLPLSSMSLQTEKDQINENRETKSPLNLARDDENPNHEMQVEVDIYNLREPEADNRNPKELKLQTVHFMNGRKVLTSLLNQNDFTEIAGNYNDLSRVDNDIDSNHTSSDEINTQPIHSQLQSLPIWWQKQNDQKTDRNEDASLAGRMAIAHSKQANMNAVENKEPNNTSDKNVSNRQIVDPYEVNLLAGSMALPVSEQTNIGAVTKREPNDVADGKASKISTLKNHLPSTFGVKESSLDMAANSANNGADINASASIKNNFDIQIINNMVAAMNLANKENHIAENDVSISQFVQNVSIPKPIKANEKDTSAFLLQNSKLMPAKHDSSLFMEKSASNDFIQAVDALDAKPKISVEKISQNTDILTNTFITQHSVNENILQAQGQQTFHNTQAFSKPALGEQIINIVVKEIQVPQEDGIDSLRIEITPPDLGDLEIELQKQGKDLEVRILASTEAAAEAIKDHTSVLKNILGNQDFNRVQVNVDIGKREHSNQQQQGNAKQDDQNNQHEQRILKVRIHNGVIDTFV